MRNDRRTLFGWAMYDWANSAYVVIAVAILPAYFGSVIIPEEGWMGLSAEALWGYMVGLVSLALFLITPVLGAIADYRARRLRFMRVFAYSGALFAVCFALVTAGAVVPAIVVFLISHFAFATANVFYDGLLPLITTDDTIDQVSSRGYAFGYVGGGIYLLVAMLFIFYSEEWGVAESSAARLAIGGSGIWWAGFSWYAFRRLREVGQAQVGESSAVGYLDYLRIGFSRTWKTCRNLSRHRQLLLFVLAYIFYIDGVQTVINVSAIYASETLEISTAFIALVFLITQFMAFFGALLFGRLSERIGPKRSISLALVVWTATLVAAYYLPVGQNYPFLALGMVIGLVLGGTQALSRSLYASIIPQQASAEFFGFFSVFTKFSAIWGPIIFATFRQVTGSSRPAVLSLIVFFGVGLVLLSRVNVHEARSGRAAWRAVKE